MKVVLLADVKGLGVRGSLCDVGDGYALNFLIPKGQALEASSERGKQLILQYKEKGMKQEKDVASDSASFASLPKEVLITQRANEQGTLFQTVTGEHIAEALRAKGVEAASEWFPSVAIKEVGSHVVTALHGEATASVTIRIEAL